MDKVQHAVATFQSGFNCSQASLRTYGPDCGLSPLDSLRVGCGFGRGMHRGDTCGAVIGALMVLGLRCGPQNTSDTSAKYHVYSKVIDFCSRYESRSGCVVCRDLLGCDIGTAEGMKHAKSDNLFGTVCHKVVQIAAEILEQMC